MIYLVSSKRLFAWFVSSGDMITMMIKWKGKTAWVHCDDNLNYPEPSCDKYVRKEKKLRYICSIAKYFS